MLHKLVWTIRRSRFLKKYKTKILSETRENLLSQDNAEEATIVEVVFYDVYDNKKFTKLIKKLYKGKKDKNLIVETSYFASRFRKINYIRPQFDYTSYGKVGDITIRDENIIKKIHITSTQINNEEALVCFECSTRIICDNKNIASLVKKNIMSLVNFPVTPVYHIENCKGINDESRINMELFYLIIQSTIRKYCYLNYGEKYQLPRLTRVIYKKKTEEMKEYLKDPFLENTYTMDDCDTYYVVDKKERAAGIDITEYIFGASWSNQNLLDLFTQYRMEAYYTFFYGIEVAVLEQKITKFLNSKRNSIIKNDYKWLLSKLRKTDESLLYDVNNISMSNINLKGYSKNANEKFIQDNILRNKFNGVYKNNIDYYSAFYGSNYNKTVLIVATLTLILTLFTLLR